MDITLSVIGGLGLFLYGMNIMGKSLEKTAGKKLSNLIKVLTTNRFTAALVGTFVTMIIQSSSATTVMVIGFVNAGLMTLNQAVGVIMGANIGTTITAQMIALNLNNYGPLALGIGVGFWSIYSKEKLRNLAGILIGFGVIFIGMNMISIGLRPLSNNSFFINILVSLNNPILGVIGGALLTTILQSSSAAIGLLQALAGEGLLNMSITLPILFGQNVGTTTTALIASVGANINAKRAAIVHLLFNLIGTIIFMCILRYPLEIIVMDISPSNVKIQIANAHTIFNIVNVLIQLPFGGFLVKTAERLVPENKGQEINLPLY